MLLETLETQKWRHQGLVSRVWKSIFGSREDVKKLLQAMSKEEEEDVRPHLLPVRAQRPQPHHRT